MNFPISNNNALAVLKFLEKLNCCQRCILRFLGLHVSTNEEAYKNPKQFFNELENSQENRQIEQELDELEIKKLKPNLCSVCLGCFEPDIIEKLIEKSSLNVKDYQYSNFFFNVSFPKCLAVRAHRMYLHLKKNFPEVSLCSLYNTGPDPAMEQPHKIFRLVASKVLSTALNKTYHPKSNLNLLLTIGYEDDNLEVQNIKEMIHKKPPKKGHIEISRNNMSEILKVIDGKEFEKHFMNLPQTPEKEIFLEKTTVTADPVYIGGRYLKFQRNVGQTPWIIDGVSVSEHNIQDIIFDAVCEVLRCNRNEMTFTASGREDLDVRMLGTGRPFYIKLDNPRTRQFTKEQFREIERQIISSELAAVINLQTIYASDLEKIKFGEEHKKKTYRALCKTTCPDVTKVIDTINGQNAELKITQLTPMRVLHRRTLLSREKVIHKLCATPVLDHSDLFELEVKTQAGTYVKEFIHGDFHRTTPSISSLVGHPTDLVALDCTNIDLEWPSGTAPET